VTYFTGAVPTPNAAPFARARLIAHPEVGILLQPESHLERELEHFAAFGVDNGCFALGQKGGEFDAAGWLAWVDTLPRSAAFVAIPDVLNWITTDAGERVPVGDAAATLALFPTYAPQVRAMGFPVALVAQDGLEDLSIPWDDLDAIFVGGSDAWKLGPAAAAITREAKARGKHVHVGRVNSAKRYRYALEVMGADSADGTLLAFGPDVNTRRLLSEPSPKSGKVTRWLTPLRELELEHRVSLAA
jgi:hypothetical protein